MKSIMGGGKNHATILIMDKKEVSQLLRLARSHG